MIRYKEGYNYILTERHIIQTALRPEKKITVDGVITLYKNGKLELKKRFAWDGASGPMIDTKSALGPSAEHDAKYQLFRLRLLSAEKWKDVADQEFRDRVIEDGTIIIWRDYPSDGLFDKFNRTMSIAVLKTRANGAYCVLKNFGNAATMPENDNPVLTAP